MQTTAETAVATKQEAMTETPASPGKSKKKKDAAGSSAQVAASPAGPSTQDDAQEVTMLSHHTMCVLECHQASVAAGSPEQAECRLS